MTDRIAVPKSSPATTFYLEADVVSQSTAANQSVVRLYRRAMNGPGGSTGSFFGNNGSHSISIDGVWGGDTRNQTPFLPSGVPNGGTRWRDGAFNITVNHNSSGYATITLRMGLAYGSVNEQHTATLTLPRIARVPQAPSITSISNVTTSSARVNGTVPDNMGAAINQYEFQAATNAAFTTGVVTQGNFGQIHDVTGLAPGQQYWFRMRAQNAVGWSAWSGSASVFVGLPAPTLNSWTQNSTGGLVAAWSAPTPATGLTGYRLQVATDSGFTSGVQNLDIGNVLTHTVTGLAGGRQYWVRVAARTSGGVNAYSSSRSTLLVLDSGDLDGWTRIGTKPAAISYYTATGIRRGTVGTKQALWIESLSTAATSLAADTFGIQKVLPTVVGKAYRVEATMTGGFSSAPMTGQATNYRLAVNSTLGALEGLADGSTTHALPAIEFVAAATFVTVKVLMASALTVPGAMDAVERIAITGIKLLELDTDFPQRLRETVYESNLANHFDLACNSVGASWYVGRDGVTRFTLPGEFLPVSAVFSDEVGDGALHYVDVSAAYDTRSMVNRIEATNYGVDAARVNEENDTLVVTSDTSIDAYGTRSERVELNLYDLAPYASAVTDRLADLLDDYDQPSILISQLRWNAQENPEAAQALEVGQRITVRYRGTDYDNQIVAISHDITPTRWMVTLQLRVL